MFTKSGTCDRCALKGRKHVAPVGLAKADILVLAGFPLEIDGEKGGFMSPAGIMLKDMVHKHLNTTYTPSNKPTVAYMYSTQCIPAYDAVKKKYNNTAENLKNCAYWVQSHIDAAKPKVIVAMGGDALKSLNITGNPSALRGGIYSFAAKNDTAIPVIATYHPAELVSNIGVFETVQKDLQKAYYLASGADLGGTVNITILKTKDAIVQKLAEVEHYLAAEFAKNGQPCGIAVDTETTSLTPSNKDDRVIAISISHQYGVGFSYPFEHKACPFTPAEFAQVKTATEKLLSSKYATLVMHNGKFDMQWLRNHYGMHIHSPAFDTMLAEHILDEDKKGEYSLKAITKDRMPGMGKYEDELKHELSKTQERFNEEYKIAKEAWNEATKVAILNWWKNIGEDSRYTYLATWVGQGIISMADAAKLRDIKLVKRKGELVVPKSYKDAVSRLVSRVDTSQLQGLVLPEKTCGDAPRDVTFEDIDVDIMLKYAAIDAQATRMISRHQGADFKADSKLVAKAAALEKTYNRVIHSNRLLWAFQNITMPLSEALGDMEYHGVRLDREKCAAFQMRVTERMAEIKDSLFQQQGRAFSLSSSAPDLGVILYEEMKLPILKTTESGAPSTDADTLKQLADEHEDAVFLKDLLAYRKMEKVLRTYLNNWLKMSARDGRIHCSFLQTGTVTGRLSSSNPNLQNVPFSLKDLGLNLKSLFLPDDGYQLVELDISAAELRALCAYSQDQALINAFNEGKDLHCLTGAAISQYSYADLLANKEDKTTDQYQKRQLAKKVNFGTVYCIGAEGLANQLWAELRIREDAATCQKYLDDFFTAYPGVKWYIEDTKRFASLYKFVTTLTGRRRRFFAVRHNSSLASRMARQAVNARIQSTASDLVQFNLIDLYNYLKQEQLGRILLTVHDSIVFQVPMGYTGLKDPLYNIITTKTAERFAWLPVEWKFDAGCGPNYGDAHAPIL